MAIHKKLRYVLIIILICVIISCNSDKKKIPAEQKEKKDSTSTFPGYNTSEIFTPELIKEAVPSENQITVKNDQDIKNSSFRTTSTFAYINEGRYRAMKLFIRSGNQQETEGMFKKAKESASDFDRKPAVTIDNLGDQAFWSGPPTYQLNLLKDNTWVILTLTLRDFSEKDETVIEDGKKIAELVLKKMQ